MRLADNAGRKKLAGVPQSTGLISVAEVHHIVETSGGDIVA